MGDIKTSARAALAALLGLVPFVTSACSSEEAPRELTLEERLAADERISPLVSGCPFGKAYEGDTSNIIPILVDKLESGQQEPLRYARIELGRIGEPAIPELKRLYDGAFSDRWRAGVLTNVVDAVTRMEEPWGLEILRSAMLHPQESVRLRALDGITKHGSPEDYDTIALWLTAATNMSMRLEYASCMSALDPERFARDLADWIEQRMHQDIWVKVAGTVGATEDPEVAALLYAAREFTTGQVDAYLSAPAARLGNIAALADLRGMLVDELPDRRRVALDAVLRSKLFEEALVVLEQDESADLRVSAAQILAQAPASEELLEWLELALTDESPKVREAVLVELCRLGSERGITEAFALLEGTIADRQVGIRALRTAWDVEGTATRAYGVLTRLFEERTHASAAEQVNFLQTLAQVPGRATAEYLMQVADRVGIDIRGISAHRWCAIQVVNAGQEAFAYMRERLASEADPERQIDLIEAVWQDKSEDSRELLLSLLHDADLNPHVLVYAADRLTRIGPTDVVAPLLKRAYLANTDAVARPALHCLVWTWL